MAEIDDLTVRRARLRAQFVVPRRRRDAVGIVRRLVVVQSQDRFACGLGVWARGSGFTAEQVERLRVDQRVLTRTWLHRQTIQLLATEDLGWLTALLGPRAARAARSAWGLARPGRRGLPGATSAWTRRPGTGDGRCCGARSRMGRWVAPRSTSDFGPGAWTRRGGDCRTC